ncbi:MAG TPA: MarR family transcriptional regulator [Bacillota bacterium]|nr:MarR family transcriptional regulator [Bacillota bacterium]
MTAEDSTVRKLLQAFLQFKKANWHHRSLAGFKPSEVTLLFVIRSGATPEAPHMTVSEISRRLHVTSPTVTQLITGLEAKGLVERNMDRRDRRAVLVRLTEAGEKITLKARQEMFASLSGLIDFLGEEESKHLVTLLNKTFIYFNNANAAKNQQPLNGEKDND